MDEYDHLLLTAVHENDIHSIQTCLSSASDPNIYLNRIYDESNDQKCTLLMIACLNRYNDIVRMLLTSFKPDLEVLNVVRINTKDTKLETYENVTVLWTAAAIDNFSIVKLLVEHGANINHRTSTNSTPVRCACYSGNLEMVRYLVKHGADIRINKQTNETNLAMSVYHQHFELSVYLVEELGCDVNECNSSGRSPLYFAVESGSFELTEYLLKNGARNFLPTCNRMSPLMLAADKRLTKFVDEIASHCSLLERIEAIELLGSAFSSAEHGPCDLQQSYEYYRQALELRFIHQFPKSLRESTNDVFHHRQECQTVGELNEIRMNSDEMHIEALLIRERLLGAESEDYRYSVVYRGAVLSDNEQLDQGIALWLYELSLRQQYSIPVDENRLRRFGRLFCKLISRSLSPSVEAILTVIATTIQEVIRHTEKIDFNLYSLLFLITIISQSSVSVLISSDNRRVLNRLIYSINQGAYVTRNERSSLLHLSVCDETSAYDISIDDICKYPCLNTARMLLQCGADVNAGDADGNTPLHILVCNSGPCDNNILELLCNAGGHFDYTNAQGKTPMDLALRIDTKQLLQTKMQMKLKCLCARLIRKSNFLYQEQITQSLVNFVDRH